eukprot:TRINITY_DN600_c0_g1_i1.p2 TRINITY_DN600_c0_g1~~TRINITY_DN600_c0_g1_i1.p2  ORF type:complete len:108 (-),score=50.12 TRINITY_DN600_c0_g1_i1:33-356(-)
MCKGLVQLSGCEALCEEHTSCGDCSAAEGCGWCKVGETRKCIDTAINSTPCLTELVCGHDEPAGSSGGGKTGSFFLGMFVLALLLVAGYVGFKYYEKRKGGPLYTSI